MNINARQALLPLAASLALGLVAQQAAAATISTSVVIPVVSGDGYHIEIPVSGLAQFDPANGTLTGIELGLHIESYDVTLSLGSWDAPETGGDEPEAGAEFESATLSMEIYFDVALSPTSGLMFASTSFADTIYDEYDTVSVFGEPGTPVIEDAMARLTDYGLLSDFIGTGNVSIVSFGVIAFDDPERVNLDDGTTTSGAPHIDSFTGGPSTMSIHYTYTPAVVPLPAGVWLLGSALLGLAGIRRRMT